MSSMPEDTKDTDILDARALRRFAPGALLGNRYQIASELGRGGMGVVYRATDRELLREVAVKVVPEASSSPEARQRLLREARAAAGRGRRSHSF